jgi:hypothetical protein
MLGGAGGGHQERMVFLARAELYSRSEKAMVKKSLKIGNASKTGH